MNYREQQRAKAVEIRDKMMKDPGQGDYSGKPRDFVLSDPVINLWEGIRDDAKEYFNKNNIKWWGAEKEEPSGHMLSSQIACINHLFFVRQRKDIATALLKAIDSLIVESAIVDDGNVEFEFIGKKRFLKERSFTRGANCTSVDAAMIGVRPDNSRVLFLIEWKYTEVYAVQNKYIPDRAKVYDALIKASDSPFKHLSPDAFYYEPFYQMMRQTLLAEQIVKYKDHDCNDYYHVHVIPKNNTELLNTITSPELSGNNITEAWKAILNRPQKYISISPEDFIRPTANCPDTKSILNYLEKRYWI